MTGLTPFYLNTTGLPLARDDPAFQLAKDADMLMLVPLLNALPQLPDGERMYQLRLLHPNLDPLSAAIAVNRLQFVVRPGKIRDELMKLVQQCLLPDNASRPHMGPALSDSSFDASGQPRLPELQTDTVLGRLLAIKALYCASSEETDGAPIGLCAAASHYLESLKVISIPCHCFVLITDEL